MKVLLAIPPNISGSGDSKYQVTNFLNFSAPPLGLAYMASVLEEAGYKNKVRLLDSRTIGLTSEDFKRVIKRFRPDILGLQIKTPNYYDAVEVSRIAKEEDVPYVIWGGHHASPMAEEVLTANQNVDIVFRGEAEYTFRDFVQAVDDGKDWTGIRGISYRENGFIKHTPNAPLIKDINELPFPARHLLPMDSYRIFGSALPATTMITSRGCPYDCEFCAVTSFYGRRWRTRTPENIAAEMEEIREKYGVKAVAFVDDLFFTSEKRVLRICKAISDVRRTHDIYWGATVRADRGGLKMLTTMRKAGCRLIFVGVESGDQEILDSVKKETNLGEIEQFFRNSKKAHMDTLASISFGFPGETKQTIRKTMDWTINVLDPSLAIFTISTPYPGTPFFNQMREEDKIKEFDFSKYNLFNPIVDLTGISRDELKEEVKECYKRFYLRPSKIMQNTIRELKYAMESYGLRMFASNSKLFAKGIINMKVLTNAL
ncbi:MAG: B12-binding domain-containing radical SAM protein [Candidatus Hodarchaeales archaeon]|jgi:radical SAM superfamily enzyme YgiQ (UPF0313 family)